MIPLAEARKLLRDLGDKETSEYEITPKISQAIKRDMTKFKKELFGVKKINRPKVVQAVKDVLALLVDPEHNITPIIHWASELQPKDMLSHRWRSDDLQGMLGQRWGGLYQFDSVVNGIEYPVWGQKKWNGNAEEDLYSKSMEVGRITNSYRGRVERLVNDAKILSGHLYRTRLRAPKQIEISEPDSGPRYWYGKRYTEDSFRCMLPASLTDRFKAWVVGKHFIENTDLVEYMAAAKEIATSLYCFYLRGNHVILVEKPEVHMEVDARGWGYQPHNDSGPAVYFPELKKSIYCLHGVKVPKTIVTTPADKLDPKLMVETRNAEVRRELVRKLGIDKIFEALGATTLDKSEDGVYELVSLNIGDTRTRPYLKMLNPSIGTWHFEGVRPGCSTVIQALEFRNGTIGQPEVLT